jgi:bifunctional ADP-heptose synthase (sugar kinase/adenylyltransferase)
MNNNILVIGDVILDEYTHGKKLGVSAETPTIVADYQKTERFVGGAGLVVRHLLRLGANVRLLTVGSDESLRIRLRESADPPTDEEMGHLHYSPIIGKGWKWTEKRRFYVDDYKMVQYDIRNDAYYSMELRKIMTEAYVQARNIADAVVVCDNRHGTLDYNIMDLIRQKKERYGGKLFVDCQVSQADSNHSNYAGADMMFLNLRELEAVVGRPKEQDCIVDRVLRAKQRLHSGITLKLGHLGSATVFKDSDDYHEHEAYGVRAVDTCGAGDAFLAAYAVSEDLEFANKWAGLSTTYKGTIVPEKGSL